MFVIHFLFSLVFCQNFVKNPSFEETEDNKLKEWKDYTNGVLSTDSHSGRYSLNWKPQNKSVIVLKYIDGVENDFQYEVCVYYKLKNIRGFQLAFANNNESADYKEVYYSSILTGTNDDWKLFCYRTKNLKRSSGQYDKFFVELFTQRQIDPTNTAETFIDDVSVYRVTDIIRVGINNDRDEVYDKINVICEIKSKKGKYSLNDWDNL